MNLFLFNMSLYCSILYYYTSASSKSNVFVGFLSCFLICSRFLDTNEWQIVITISKRLCRILWNIAAAAFLTTQSALFALHMHTTVKKSHLYYLPAPSQLYSLLCICILWVVQTANNSLILMNAFSSFLFIREVALRFNNLAEKCVASTAVKITWKRLSKRRQLKHHLYS